VVGEGSTFSFTLPLAAGAPQEVAPAARAVARAAVQTAPAPQAAAPQPARPATPAASHAAKRILLVGDDPDVARPIGDQLRAAGYSVRTVASGEAALDAIAQERPDLVTLDLHLPNMSGADLAERLAMNPETTDLPVLVISVEDRDPRLKQYGVRALPKRLGQEQILASIADLLAESERRPVLVIDDEPDVRELLRANLSRAGLEVIFAESGREGIERARERRPGLILLDLMLPGVDGFSVLQSLKQHAETASIPVVAMTAHDDIRLRAKARLLSMGASDLVAKPLDMKALIQEVQLLIQAEE
jgi:CheY-like chemotaxis protein